MNTNANTIDITNMNEAELDALLGVAVDEDAEPKVHRAYLTGYEARTRAEVAADIASGDMDADEGAEWLRLAFDR